MGGKSEVVSQGVGIMRLGQGANENSGESKIKA